MREIKFRSWDTRESRWLNNVEVCAVIAAYQRGESPEYYALGQYTGLKDKNGKDIYEGDVIEYTQHMFNTEKVRLERKDVRWNNDRWNVYETNAGESNIEIIGNIHENPELL